MSKRNEIARGGSALTYICLLADQLSKDDSPKAKATDTAIPFSEGQPPSLLPNNDHMYSFHSKMLKQPSQIFQQPMLTTKQGNANAIGGERGVQVNNYAIDEKANKLAQKINSTLLSSGHRGDTHGIYHGPDCVDKEGSIFQNGLEKIQSRFIGKSASFHGGLMNCATHVDPQSLSSPNISTGTTGLRANNIGTVQNSGEFMAGLAMAENNAVWGDVTIGRNGMRENIRNDDGTMGMRNNNNGFVATSLLNNDNNMMFQNQSDFQLQQQQQQRNLGHDLPLSGEVVLGQQYLTGSSPAVFPYTDGFFEQGNFGNVQSQNGMGSRIANALRRSSASVQGERKATVPPPKKQRKKRAKSFPEKLWDVLSRCSDEDCVAWLPDGNSFVIVNDELFVQKILCKAFKASKYSSFVRKLHRWGFVRLSSGTGTDCFHHPMFQRDKADLVQKITSTPRGRGDKQRTKPPSLVGVEQFIQSKVAAAKESCKESGGISHIAPKQGHQLPTITAAPTSTASFPNSLPELHGIEPMQKIDPSNDCFHEEFLHDHNLPTDGLYSGEIDDMTVSDDVWDSDSD